MMSQKVIKSVLLLVGLAGLTACPSNSSDRVNTVAPNQTLNGPGPVSGPNGPGLPGQVDSVIKTIQCEFEGRREKSSSFFSSRISIPKTISLITLDGSYETPIDLRTKFLGIDIGKFGKISLQYVPASKTKSGTDTIILIDDGVNKNLRMSQSGFAGQLIKLEAQQDGMFVNVSCRGTSQFKAPTVNTGKTNLVCKGKSSTVVTPEEQVNVIIPLNSLQAGQDVVISDAVTAKLDTAATTITFSGSLDPEYGALITSTASLKSSATFRLIEKEKNSANEINITCNIQ